VTGSRRRSQIPLPAASFQLFGRNPEEISCMFFPARTPDGQTKSCCIFVDLIHLTSRGLRRNLRTSLDVCCLVPLLPGFRSQEALWLSALFSPTPVLSARRMRPLPRFKNADFTSRHSWQIVAALPSCTRDENQEMRLSASKASAKGLESTLSVVEWGICFCLLRLQLFSVKTAQKSHVKSQNHLTNTNEIRYSLKFS
jgi:hypothetical protein